MKRKHFVPDPHLNRYIAVGTGKDSSITVFTKKTKEGTYRLNNEVNLVIHATKYKIARKALQAALVPLYKRIAVETLYTITKAPDEVDESNLCHVTTIKISSGAYSLVEIANPKSRESRGYKRVLIL
jgi:hypothetical protein